MLTSRHIFRYAVPARTVTKKHCCLAKIHAAIVDIDAVHTIIAGDFNCVPNSRFYTEFANFADENNLVTTDLNRLSDTVTYISDDGCKSSWIDHILCSYSVDTISAYFKV